MKSRANNLAIRKGSPLKQGRFNGYPLKQWCSKGVPFENLIAFDAGFVVYCSDDDCGSSEELAISLQEKGFANIFLFKGGWKLWTENDLPVNVK